MYTLKEAEKITGVKAEAIKTKIRRGLVEFVTVQEGNRIYRKVTLAGIEQLKKEKPQADYFRLHKQWTQDQASGYHTGKALTERAIESNHYGLKRYWHYLGLPANIENINAKNLRKALSNVPVDNENRNCRFSQREQMYKAVCSFMKLLIREQVKAKIDLEALKDDEIRPRRIYPPRKTVCTEKEVKKLLWKATDHHHIAHNTIVCRLMIMLSAYAGLRAAEIVGLQIKDIDLNKHKMVVWGKGRKRRIVGMVPKLRYAITYWLTKRPQSAIGNLLVSKTGGVIPSDSVNKRIRLIAKEAGIDVTPHGLRRSFATIMESKGMAWSHLQMTLGHNDVRTTQGYVMPDEQAAVDFLAKR